MAKLSKDLFDEIIEEMMSERKSMMEMMAELDVDDQAIFDAQERIAKKKQALARGETPAAGGDKAKAKEGAPKGDKKAKK